MKPAKVGSVVEWHQDLAYFPHTNVDLVSTLIYLDEATEENGCLQVLPRHHHHFFEHSDAEGRFVGMISEDLSNSRFGRPIPLTAPAGSVIFMHCLTPHSSLPNRSPHPRRTLIFEYRAADAFPIWYGPMTAKGEAIHRPIRGRTARFADVMGRDHWCRTSAPFRRCLICKLRQKSLWNACKNERKTKRSGGLVRWTLFVTNRPKKSQRAVMTLDPVELLRQLIQIPSVNPMGRGVSGPPFGEQRLTDFLQDQCAAAGPAVAAATRSSGTRQSSSVSLRVPGAK